RGKRRVACGKMAERVAAESRRRLECVCAARSGMFRFLKSLPLSQHGLTSKVKDCNLKSTAVDFPRNSERGARRGGQGRQLLTLHPIQNPSYVKGVLPMDTHQLG